MRTKLAQLGYFPYQPADGALRGRCFVLADLWFGRISSQGDAPYSQWARKVGEAFREGSPVLMDLTEMPDYDAKRLVDFAAGLIFGRRGSIERIRSRIFLLVPGEAGAKAEVAAQAFSSHTAVVTVIDHGDLATYDDSAGVFDLLQSLSSSS